jgi:uracil-DNA glycosylase family 4
VIDLFDSLVRDAQSCTTCARMCGRKRVLGPKNGTLSARVLFVAEAPGRLGAEVTGVPLSGDQSGRNFEHIIYTAGLTREEIFVTNAVLCNPVTVDGRNDKPTRLEIANCNTFLAATIDLVAPDLVIALGVAALTALSGIEAHALTLRTDLARPSPWYGRLLAPLYHPSPRTRVFRSLEDQARDLSNCLAAASPYCDANFAARGQRRRVVAATREMIVCDH